MVIHKTVLLEEAVAALNIRPGFAYIDATLGAGGHTTAIIQALNALNAQNTFLGLDADGTALTAFQARLPATTATVVLVESNFLKLTDVITTHEITKVGGILADLGWRMEQFQGGGKGFSFMVDEPLLMTYGNPDEYAVTAADIINEWDEADIANVLYGYGEERASRRLASAIVTARSHGAITTSGQLAAIIEQAYPKRGWQRIHPATKTFQALRIAVNDELSVLEVFLKDAFAALTPTGRLAIITFHSLEDRIVKHTFRTFTEENRGTLITKKPITATPEALQANPRARSAKLRIIEKV